MDGITKHISNRMEDDGIRLQMEAELKREISEEQWLSEVNQWVEEIKYRCEELSCSVDEAYEDMTR